MITMNMLITTKEIYKVLWDCLKARVTQNRRLPQRRDVMKKDESFWGGGVPIIWARIHSQRVTIWVSNFSICDPTCCERELLILL